MREPEGTKKNNRTDVEGNGGTERVCRRRS